MLALRIFILLLAVRMDYLNSGIETVFISETVEPATLAVIDTSMLSPVNFMRGPLS